MQGLKDDHCLDGSSIPSATARGGKKRKGSSTENSEYLTAMNEMNRQMAFLNVTLLGGKIGDLEEEAMNIRTKMWRMEREQAPA